MPGESKLETWLIKEVRARGGMCLKLALVNLIGWPDRAVFLPGGRVIFLELKNPNGRSRVSKQQEIWTRRLTTLGFEAYITDDKEEIIGVLDNIA